jgi:hypothetical protein
MFYFIVEFYVKFRLLFKIGMVDIMGRSKNVISLFVLFIGYSLLLTAQSEFKPKTIGLEFQISVEKQAYIEKATNSKLTHLVDIEKYAPFNFPYQIEVVFKTSLMKKLSGKYSIGYKHVELLFDYYDMISSESAYQNMGYSDIKADYATLGFGINYNLFTRRKVHFLPGISLGSSFLLNKDEKLIPKKSTFSLINDPTCSFKSIVPEIAVDFLIETRFWQSKYLLTTGLCFKSNPKYFFEKTGILFSPLSLGLKLGITKTL